VYQHPIVGNPIHDPIHFHHSYASHCFNKYKKLYFGRHKTLFTHNNRTHICVMLKEAEFWIMLAAGITATVFIFYLICSIWPGRNN
jgi:hypothetical protein